MPGPPVAGAGTLHLVAAAAMPALAGHQAAASKPRCCVRRAAWRMVRIGGARLAPEKPGVSAPGCPADAECGSRCGGINALLGPVSGIPRCNPSASAHLAFRPTGDLGGGISACGAPTAACSARSGKLGGASRRIAGRRAVDAVQAIREGEGCVPGDGEGASPGPFRRRAGEEGGGTARAGDCPRKGDASASCVAGNPSHDRDQKPTDRRAERRASSLGRAPRRARARGRDEGAPGPSRYLRHTARSPAFTPHRDDLRQPIRPSVPLGRNRCGAGLRNPRWLDGPSRGRAFAGSVRRTASYALGNNPDRSSLLGRPSVQGTKQGAAEAVRSARLRPLRRGCVSCRGWPPRGCHQISRLRQQQGGNERWRTAVVSCRGVSSSCGANASSGCACFCSPDGEDRGGILGTRGVFLGGSGAESPRCQAREDADEGAQRLGFRGAQRYRAENWATLWAYKRLRRGAIAHFMLPLSNAHMRSLRGSGT